MVKPRRWLVLLMAVLVTAALAPAASAHPDGSVTDDPSEEHEHGLLEREATGAALEAHDVESDGLVSSGPFADVTKNLAAVGMGVRDVAGATTDVWAHDGYAYTGTFNSPCGGDPEAGVWVWDVHNKSKPAFVTVIPSELGSRSNDVKVDTMNSGEILVHSNESCDDGPGGFEIYEVSDPANPTHLSSVRIDDPNPLTPFIFGPITDVGVHNLFLFTQGSSDYVAVTTETAFGNFHIYDITDPANPALVSFWGAEEVFDPGVVASGDFNRNLSAAIWLTNGFGASANRFLHDTTVTADGQQVYLANWDAGLILLDISDPANPTLVSVAIDPTSEDGEVNSHSVWPSEDGTIVMEGEEDFSPFASVFTIDTGPNAGDYPAAEGAITTPIVNEPGQQMSGSTTYVGLACDGTVPDGSGIALIQRGVCAFTTKIDNAEAAGYSGVVVFNDEARGDALVTMGGTSVNLPGVFVGHSTGLAIAGVTTAADLVIGAGGEEITAAAIPDGWSGFRIWDYSDPANPVLASTFNTVCSATVIDPSCDPAGTYSSHNVIVETVGNKVKAYISWYNDGIVILDITDPYNPVETARYLEAGQDFWGIDKIPGEPWIYGSDRNGGLVIVKEFGSGSAKKGKATP